ncbi:MAG: hypothetical protein A2583_06590 [Bdellovibrionales bacterium RIFOXYD1_FULL_53_11]|nr:MAG: hypothetical protein A2583_06590 [Bdellovibrionales bacterium RIFOXYD1_FULL_53_11]
MYIAGGETLFVQHLGITGARTLDYFKKHMTGYRAAQKAAGMTTEAIIDEVKRSWLRGRGGAGFPTGTKWSFVPKTTAQKYLVCNADESEPGTFKDRAIIRNMPHMLVEGMIIAARAIGASRGYIYIRGEYEEEAGILEEALKEARDAGQLGKVDIFVHRGAGAYICGEETGLLNSLEGLRGEPRDKPPFPAVKGAFDGPTVVNNVETLACIPSIIMNGGAWFAGLGRIEKSGGTRLVGVSGQVNRPGLYEIPAGGATIREIIYDICGGIADDRQLRAVIPGGSSTPPLSADEIDVVYDIEPLACAGSMLGSAAMIVVSEDYCLVRLLERIVLFYERESCGQCTPCREGVAWARKILSRIERGTGTDRDISLLLSVADSINGKALCALGDAAALPIMGFVKKFRADFEAHVRGGRCPGA